MQDYTAIAPIIGLLGLAMAGFIYVRITRMPAGTEQMRENRRQHTPGSNGVSQARVHDRGDFRRGALYRLERRAHHMDRRCFPDGCGVFDDSRILRDEGGPTRAKCADNTSRQGWWHECCPDRSFQRRGSHGNLRGFAGPVGARDLVHGHQGPGHHQRFCDGCEFDRPFRARRRRDIYQER